MEWVAMEWLAMEWLARERVARERVVREWEDGSRRGPDSGRFGCWTG